MGALKIPVCNKDCFNCPFPDCINDEMDHEDYIEAAARDKELRATPKSKKLAAQKKAYYEANREKVAAQKSEIADVRKRLGLSQTQAAKLLGVSQALLSFWENGRVPCDWEAVAARLRKEKEGWTTLPARAAVT